MRIAMVLLALAAGGRAPQRPTAVVGFEGDAAFVQKTISSCDSSESRACWIVRVRLTAEQRQRCHVASFPIDDGVVVFGYRCEPLE